MNGPDDSVVTQSISIAYGIDGETQLPFWATNFENQFAENGLPDVVTGLGMLCCAAIDLMQKHGMIPMPPGQED